MEIHKGFMSNFVEPSVIHVDDDRHCFWVDDGFPGQPEALSDAILVDARDDFGMTLGMISG